MVPLCSTGWPESHCADQAGFELRHLPSSASGVLGIKVYDTMSS